MRGREGGGGVFPVGVFSLMRVSPWGCLTRLGISPVLVLFRSRSGVSHVGVFSPCGVISPWGCFPMGLFPPWGRFPVAVFSSWGCNPLRYFPREDVFPVGVFSLWGCFPNRAVFPVGVFPRLGGFFRWGISLWVRLPVGREGGSGGWFPVGCFLVGGVSRGGGLPVGCFPV